MSTTDNNLTFPQDLGDGLTLHRAARADTDRVVDFICDNLNDGLGINLRDLMTKEHPTAEPGDVVFVTDSRANEKMVGVVGMIPHTWAYDDILFGVGNPEFVSTDADYRGRGLFRTMMDAIHAISTARGHLAQAVMGVPWLYRRLGYEYALDLDHRRQFHLSDVPALPPGEPEQYGIRAAAEADLPVLLPLYKRACTGMRVCNVLSEARWRFDLTQHSDGSDIKMHIMVITEGDTVIGYYKTWWDPWGSFRLQELALAEYCSYRAVMPRLFRHIAGLRAVYHDHFAGEFPTRIIFALGQTHPLYDAYDRQLTPLECAGAWYLRVPDLPRFLQHIAPALERRLAGSALSGYDGTLYLNGYTAGLDLVFAHGRLARVDPVEPGARDSDWFASGGDAHFPPGVFLKLLFGYRTLDELLYAYPDCRASDAAYALLNALFPQAPSWVALVG